ncbi:MAG: hypothetical protein GW913_02235 [Myxococcales bacterium]|nr:hypothetical protein [Myxococcales bacterium]
MNASMRRAPARLAWAALFGLAALSCGGDQAPPYAQCGGSNDCSADADTCYRLQYQRSDGSQADGRFCSLPCDAATPCPDDGVCLSLAADPSALTICYAPCDVAEDCYAGLRCTPVDGASVASVCMP